MQGQQCKPVGITQSSPYPPQPLSHQCPPEKQSATLGLCITSACFVIADSVIQTLLTKMTELKTPPGDWLVSQATVQDGK